MAECTEFNRSGFKFSTDFWTTIIQSILDQKTVKDATKK